MVAMNKSLICQSATCALKQINLSKAPGASRGTQKSRMPAAGDRLRLLSLRPNDVARSIKPVSRYGQYGRERSKEGDGKVGRREERGCEIWSDMVRHGGLSRKMAGIVIKACPPCQQLVLVSDITREKGAPHGTASVVVFGCEPRSGGPIFCASSCLLCCPGPAGGV